MGEEQERARLAKDLHDGLSGMLSGIKYSLQDMKGYLIMTEENRQAFERSIDMLDSSIQEMRRVAHNMMPEVLVRYGLDAALKDYVGEINHTGIVKVIYQSMGMENKNIEKSSAIAIYRIVQELLNNVIKHAEATVVLVQLFSENGKLVVNVEDNGKGFDTKLCEEKGGMGWRNIRSRVDLLNGKIDLQSSADHGTAVSIEFDLA
jgi:signal transduction histidine kinase